MFVPSIYTPVTIRVSKIETPCSKLRRCTTTVWKIEIALHSKANSGHCLPAIVKIIPDFNNADPMRTLLFLFWGFFPYFSIFKLWDFYLKDDIKTKTEYIKGAPNLYFMYYSYVVVILFSTGLRKSVFSTYSFGKLVFRLSVFSVCSVFRIWCLKVIVNLFSYEY